MDIEVLNWVYTTFHLGNFNWLTQIMKVITYLGDSGIASIVLAIILLIPKKTRWAGVAVALSIILDVVFVNVLIKPTVQRPRPWLDEDAVFNYNSLFGIIGEGVVPSDYSFPSGHTGVTFCVAAVLMLRYKWKGLPALIVAALVALSRIYLCVHYPSDVVVGMFIGTVCGVAAHYIIKGIQRLVNKNRKKAN